MVKTWAPKSYPPKGDPASVRLN